MPDNKFPNNQKFDYFMERTERDLDSINDKLLVIQKELTKLFGFKMFVLGASAFLSAVITLVIEFTKNGKS